MNTDDDDVDEELLEYLAAVSPLAFGEPVEPRLVDRLGYPLEVTDDDAGLLLGLYGAE